MKLPKELTTVTLLSRYLALSLFVILPVIAFFLGIRYQNEIDTNKNIAPTPIMTYEVTPTASIKQQVPINTKVTIQGTVVTYDEIPEAIDGSPTLKVRAENGTLFEVVLPSGESSCTLTPETNKIIQSLKVGNSVEVYGTAATDERIFVCYSDEFVKLWKSDVQ